MKMFRSGASWESLSDTVLFNTYGKMYAHISYVRIVKSKPDVSRERGASSESCTERGVEVLWERTKDEVRQGC